MDIVFLNEIVYHERKIWKKSEVYRTKMSERDINRTCLKQ